jgi:protein phosphatase 1G
VLLIKENKLIVANTGDSRCVVSLKNGTIKELSVDHKPHLPEETLRILKAGSKISLDGRIDRNLNLSRTIGDFAHKKKPQLKTHE